MSRLLKALQKAHKEHAIMQPSNDLEKERQVLGSSSDHSHTVPTARTIDLHMVFMGVLIILMGIGVYLNYTIALNLTTTKKGMSAIADNFKSQEQRLNKMNDLILHMDSVNNGHNKEYFAKMDQLSASMAGQIEETQNLSKAQYTDLSKTIAEQEKSIAALTGKYDRLEKSVSNYADVNSRYVEQLNLLKKKIAEINAAGSTSEFSVNK